MSQPNPRVSVQESQTEPTVSVSPGGATQDFKSAACRVASGTPHVIVPGYRILSVLGRGGMGIVYHAVQEKANRPVALKMILAGAHADQADHVRFRAEAEAAARLSHPNIVQLFEVGETPEGFPFFSLEYVAGGTLAERLKDGPLKTAEAAALIETLARAMQYAHESNIVHRDLKPANVLLAAGGRQQAAGGGATLERATSLTTSGAAATTLQAVSCLPSAVPKISDFGLAKQLDADAGMTRTGAIMGTPAYMAPEQAFGHSKNVGPAADIYALGAMLYECLTGRPPFKGATIADTLEQVRTMEPVTLRAQAKEIPADLETICLHCLHKAPQRRYSSAGALADDLRRYQEGKPISVRPVSNAERAWRWCRRNPGWAGMIASVTFLALLVIGVLWVSNDRLSTLNKDLQKQTEIAQENEKTAKKQTELAEARGEQSLQAVGLFATDARMYCDDAMVPTDSRKRLYGVLIQQLEKQADQGHGEATIDSLRNKAYMYQTLGAVNSDFGNGDTARANLEKGLATVAQWEKLKPDDATVLGFRATLLHLMGATWERDRKPADAKRNFTEALTIRRRLLDAAQGDALSTASALTSVADTLDGLEQFDESIVLREQVYKILGKDQEKNAHDKAKLRAVKERTFPAREALAWTCQKAGLHVENYAKRKELLTKASALNEELIRERPKTRNVLLRWAVVARALGELEFNYGKLAEKDGDPGKANAFFAEARKHYVTLKTISQSLATSNELLDGLRDYGRSFYTLGLVEQLNGNHKEARQNFTISRNIRAQTLHDYATHPASGHLKIDLLFSQIAVGEIKEATDAAADLTVVYSGEADAQYRLACVFALAIRAVEDARQPKPLTPEDIRNQLRFKSLALKCVENAHKDGFTDWFQTSIDADLGAIRDEPRFKNILKAQKNR